MIKLDCRHYLGTKPCKHKRVCDGCNHYDAIGERILIIKLGALGDLFRTTPIILALKKAYPRSQITWITQAHCRPLLANIPEIDRIWDTDADVTARVMAEEFDLMINFDKDAPAAQLAAIARAQVKRGFALSPRGEMIALNFASEFSLRMGIDDELKFRVNQKSYQALIHDMAELAPAASPPPYVIRLTAEEQKFGADWMKQAAAAHPGAYVMGVNPGCGKVFATKKWHQNRYVELIEKLHRADGVVPVLLGGSDETPLIEWMELTLRKKGIPVLRPGEKLSLRQFASVIAQCQGMICGDTLAMHLALAQGVRTTVIFTSTCSQEIELYGIGRSVVGRADCAPCYRSACNQPSQYCADSVSVDEVYQAARQITGLDAKDQKPGKPAKRA